VSNTYYQEELRYLREVGPEFARINPEIARVLADRGSDPDVERLLEGVAFLCGRIRQKLDDELPEITASLMNLLWPHYLRPVPSMSIEEIIPDLSGLQAPMYVAKGAEFAGVPQEGTRCRYRSCWPVTVRPWRLTKVHLEALPAKPLELVMRFRTAEKAKLSDLDLDSVRFFLSGDPRTSFTLYLLLAAHVDFITVRADGEGKRPSHTLGREHVRPAGLAAEEGVLPYPDRSFLGYRLLQEYFAFKDRFLFFDVDGLTGPIRELGLVSTLEMVITFNRRVEPPPLVSADNVRLHCVPVMNLFPQSADPLRLRHDRAQYLVRPAKSGVADPRHLEVYSVEEVHGVLQEEGGRQRKYVPFYSFEHTSGQDIRDATYYQTHVRPSALGEESRYGTDTFMTFVTGRGREGVPANETISMELTCTNRDLPRSLRAGDIREPTDTSPPSATFRNILSPTPTISPPTGKSLHWRLISHLSLNYVSLSDARRFKELLSVYDFQSEHDAQRALAHQRMLDGIVTISAAVDERLIRGAPVRGSRIEVELHEDHFAGEGDAFLFAVIVERFMGWYATINAFSQTTVRFVKSGVVHEFPPRWGEQPTPARVRRSL
jgi:type VI secretion system protein ImpG